MINLLWVLLSASSKQYNFIPIFLLLCLVLKLLTNYTLLLYIVLWGGGVQILLHMIPLQLRLPSRSLGLISGPSVFTALPQIHVCSGLSLALSPFFTLLTSKNPCQASRQSLNAKSSMKPSLIIKTNVLPSQTRKSYIKD